MSERIDIQATAELLKEWDNILIICHKNPDGDTLGTGAALYWALNALGKTSAIICSDDVPQHFDYLGMQLFHNQFTPEYYVAVDIAGRQLFGDRTAVYADKIDLCIDHHPSNGMYAKRLLLKEDAAATCELLYDLVNELNVPVSEKIADCLYTGISTDTGCFKFANTTARTHYVAAQLMEAGADIVALNEILFENKSKTRLAIEQLALTMLEFHCDDKLALVALTKEQIEETGVEAADLEGITSLPRSIEGVMIGITMRQQPSGSYKISVRTKVGINAVEICRAFGGGGHTQAAGCEIIGGLDYAKAAVLEESKHALRSFESKKEG